MHYSPVRHSSPKNAPEGLFLSLPFDLHVLGMPPAFNLSQDQTLQFVTFVPLPGHNSPVDPVEPPRTTGRPNGGTNLDSMFTGFDVTSIPVSTEKDGGTIIDISAHTNILILMLKNGVGARPDLIWASIHAFLTASSIILKKFRAVVCDGDDSAGAGARRRPAAGANAGAPCQPRRKRGPPGAVAQGRAARAAHSARPPSQATRAPHSARPPSQSGNE